MQAAAVAESSRAQAGTKEERPGAQAGAAGQKSSMEAAQEVTRSSGGVEARLQQGGAAQSHPPARPKWMSQVVVYSGPTRDPPGPVRERPRARKHPIDQRVLVDKVGRSYHFNYDQKPAYWSRGPLKRNTRALVRCSSRGTEEEELERLAFALALTDDLLGC